MAFVPKVHNREAPSANRHLDGRWQRDKHARHLQNIGRVKARIDNKWGQTYNGVTETKRASYPHVKANLKKAQLQDERYAEIEQENYQLLKKLSTILERSHNPTRNTREWGGGVRLTPNQTPVIDHCIAAKTDMFGAAIESTSLNLRHRQEERERIAAENRALVRRIQMSRPTYDRYKLENDFREREEWMRRRAFANARPISAAAAYRAAHGGSRPASAHLAGRIRPMSAVAGRARPVSAAAARPSGGGGGGGSSGKLPLDPAVEKVLQMLAAQMAGTRGRSLGEVRDARDSMMQSVWSMPQGGAVEFVQEGGVQLEVVSAPGACAVSEAALVLVHGGMFMAGSPRAVRHLAGARSRPSDLSTSTPTTTLTTTNPLRRLPLDAAPRPRPHAAPPPLARGVARRRPRQPRRRPRPHPRRLRPRPPGPRRPAAAPRDVRRVVGRRDRALGAPASFGEARGAAALRARALVAVARPHVRRHPDRGGVEHGDERPPRSGAAPSHRALLPRPAPSPPDSPSFPARVQVLKRPQLVRAAAQLLGAAGDASAPAASPLLAPPAAFRSLPPTLVHVGTTEILLDDALEFVNKCKSADVAATAKEFDGVLHGWHTFFPLMPVADAAVKEVADFLGPRLRGEPVDDVAVAPARVVAPPPPAAPAAAWTAAPPVAAPEEITQAEAVLTELDVRPTAADLAAADGARPARPASAGGARPARPSSACRRAGA